MTKHEADVIGGLNMTDQISNEAYKQIMIAAQDENEIVDVLDKIRAEIKQLPYQRIFGNVSSYSLLDVVVEIIDKYRAESEDKDANTN